MEKLTIKQAVEQGYTYCGFAGVDYQSLMPVANLNSEDFQRADEQGFGKIVLAEKEPKYHKIRPEEIMDFALDNYHDDDEIMDDTNDMENVMKESTKIFEEIANKINELYRRKNYYVLTDIELIPNE